GKVTASQKRNGAEYTDPPISSGKSGKGENLYKTGEAGKSTLPKRQTARSEDGRIEDEIPKNAKCLMDCEAAIMLGGIQEQLQALANDPTVKIPKSFDQGLVYAKSSTHYSKPDSVKQVREVLSSYKLSDVEICLIGNTCPETVDEVYSLVPSVKVMYCIGREDYLHNGIELGSE
ncbi:DNA-directed RNA polymerases IV and V subunit 4, partial [Nymphaea thermarum]